MSTNNQRWGDGARWRDPWRSDAKSAVCRRTCEPVPIRQAFRLQRGSQKSSTIDGPITSTRR